MLALPVTLLLAAPIALSLESASRLWIEGDSNVRPWVCQAQKLGVDAQAQTAEAGVPAALQRLRVVIPVGDLRCGDVHMEDKLRDALQAEQHPGITYAFTEAEALPGAAPGEHRLKAVGELTVAGKTRRVIMVVRAGVRADGALFARGSAALEMTSFGVDPPTAFLGVLKCKDRIVVRFELVARAVPTQQTALLSGAARSAP
jgi:hypothetical protein